MTSKPPFYKQETPSSCLPACLRMVAAAHGDELSEDELRERCDTTEFGTSAFNAVKAARELGFEGTEKHTLDLNQLATVVKDRLYPIVLVDLLPLDGVRDTHALIVIDISESDVTVIDPLRGERVLPLPLFVRAWERQRRPAILLLP
jgi:ATP-binding cassette, subfamily B, bacterial